MTAWYRWARAVAVLSAITAVLVALVVVTNRLPDRRPPDHVTEPAELDQRRFRINMKREAVDDYFRQFVPFMNPVPLGSIVTVTGDLGFAAQLLATRDFEADSGSYTVQIQNIGTKPFDGSFSAGGAWLETGDSRRIYPPKVQPLSTGNASLAAMGPAAEADLVLVFTVPTNVRLSRLLLSLRLGRYYPYAQWDLTLPTSEESRPPSTRRYRG